MEHREKYRKSESQSAHNDHRTIGRNHTGIDALFCQAGKNPAKKTFQAIRIAVNGELDALSQVLDQAFDFLNPGGRFAIITFHSLEDRMVKQKFADFAKGCTCPPDFPVCICGKKPRGTLVSRKPITPTEKELAENRRSRSAKLRIVEKNQEK